MYLGYDKKQRGYMIIICKYLYFKFIWSFTIGLNAELQYHVCLIIHLHIMHVQTLVLMYKRSPKIFLRHILAYFPGISQPYAFEKLTYSDIYIHNTVSRIVSMFLKYLSFTPLKCFLNYFKPLNIHSLGCGARLHLVS